MAHSVETRVPFLDHELAQFLLTCPASLKLRNGWSKWLLRQSLRGVLPEGIRLRRTKLAFNTPQAAWLRDGLRNGAAAPLTGSEFRLERIVSPSRVRRELQRFLQGASGCLDHAAAFRIMSLQVWARVYDVT